MRCAGFFLQPALSDDVIHLSLIAVGVSAGAPPPMRLPVGLEGCEIAPHAAGSSRGGWAVIQINLAQESTEVSHSWIKFCRNQKADIQVLELGT